jgi:hypothetical protein
MSRQRRKLDGPKAPLSPAPILAELLGYHDDGTNRRRRVAAGDWARYASLVSAPT